MPKLISGAELAAITREMVSMTSQHYGRGAAEAKSYQCDDFLFCVLKEALTTVERNLVEHGDGHLVREVRGRLQENNRDLFVEPIERITGREVLTYMSQVLFDPDYTVEIFLLGGDAPRR
jgi:uncharacterized protein YbcI